MKKVKLKQGTPYLELEEMGFIYCDRDGLWKYKGFDEIVIASWNYELRVNSMRIHSFEAILFNLITSGKFEIVEVEK